MTSSPTSKCSNTRFWSKSPKETGRALMVGPAMAGHEFSEGLQTIRGRTCPWNTFALWSVRDLALTGFPLVGDGEGPAHTNSGVEVRGNAKPS
jgi:hypothetical protein